MTEKWSKMCDKIIKHHTETARQRCSRKRCSENIQQTYRRTPTTKCNFNKVALQHYRNHTSPWVFSCKLLHIFGTPFPKNTSGGLLLFLSNKNKNKCICFTSQLVLIMQIKARCGAKRIDYEFITITIHLQTVKMKFF